MADPEDALLRAACVPLDSWHGAGTLEEAEAIRAAHPGIERGSVFAAAALGEESAVRAFLAADPGAATAKGGVHGWDPLTYACFSRYLRLDPARAAGLVATARALLDAGADANTGFFWGDHQPGPELECVLYGAAGVAHHPEMTALLLERGADPSDGEVVYHAPETLDDRALHLLVESGRVDADGLGTMLRRKLDWQHFEGVAWLLAHGADPNRPRAPWKSSSALHHALGRACSLRYFELLLDHGADPSLPPAYGATAAALAARRGRADVLDLFQRRGFGYALGGDDAFFEACARADEPRARAALAAEPGLVARLEAAEPALLAEFAGAGNTAGLRLLLDLGFDVAGRTSGGGASADTALHVAVWRERTSTVRLLIERGVPLEATNRRGATPLALAVRALSEQSDWTPHESTEILEALLAAGARVDSAPFPSGSAAADRLLRQHGRS